MGGGNRVAVAAAAVLAWWWLDVASSLSATTDAADRAVTVVVVVVPRHWPADAKLGVAEKEVVEENRTRKSEARVCTRHSAHGRFVVIIVIRCAMGKIAKPIIHRVPPFREPIRPRPLLHSFFYRCLLSSPCCIAQRDS